MSDKGSVAWRTSVVDGVNQEKKHFSMETGGRAIFLTHQHPLFGEKP